MRSIILIFSIVLSGCSSLGSTSSGADDRSRMISAEKCDLSLRRMLNFVRYFPPKSNYRWVMYDPGNLGFRGYDLLGDIYYFGCESAGLKSDKLAAAYWYQAAAVAHVPESQWKLGRMMFEGDGVPVSEVVGLGWITSSAIEGSEDAVEYLSVRGKLVPPRIYPSSYTIDANRARMEFDSIKEQERDRGVQNLSNLLIALGAAYIGIYSSGQAGVFSSPHDSRGQKAPTLRMSRPAYCNAQLTVNESFNTYINVRQFCY